MVTVDFSNKIGASKLVNNVVFNLMSYTVPLLAAFFAVPILENHLGTDRFGLLTLAWTVIAYFGILDLGIGRALTQLVAAKLGTGKTDELPEVVYTALLLLFLLGTLGSIVAVWVIPLVAHQLLTVPDNMKQEALGCLYVLAVSLPVLICQPGLRGILEAHQEFKAISVVRIFIGGFTFLSPLLVLNISRNLSIIVLALVVGLLSSCIIFLIMCFRSISALRTCPVFGIRLFRQILRLGGWMTVSNLLSPIMINSERFLLGSLVSMAAVAYFAVPFEVVTKLLIIPGALATVLFPAISTSFQKDKKCVGEMFHRGIKILFILLFPCSIFVILFAREILQPWMGLSFAGNSYLVMQILAVGILVNGCASVPFVLIQGIGRPDITAKLHICELPIYLVIMWYLISLYGINGAAISWSLRVIVDGMVLFIVAIKEIGYRHQNKIWKAAFLSIAIIILAFLGSIQLSSDTKIIAFGIFSLIHLAVSWSALFDRTDRLFILTKLRMA
jgi:O-antigen/teichoic acid export membrane protein